MADDVFFLSYDEPNAVENWLRLQELVPYAQRVHGVRGIANAHRACAKLARTSHFWVIDGDSRVEPEFDFSFRPLQDEQDRVHVWKAFNPVTKIPYGHGGIKLFPRDRVVSTSEMPLDFTTGLGGIVYKDELASTTRFNTDPFHAWRTAFREAVKLVQRWDTDDLARIWLERWSRASDPEVPFSGDCVSGAMEGAAFGLDHEGQDDVLGQINDMEWLAELFCRRERTHHGT